MASLVLGPLLRHVGSDDALVWVETDAPCEVEVLGCRERTWAVEGHHYALVNVSGLRAGEAVPYEVALDGSRVWPEEASRFPPSVIRPPAPGEPVTIAFGSCRVAYPHEPPWTLSKDEDPRGRGLDALRAMAARMIDSDVADWPDLLLMLGDQIYADEVAPATREFIRSRRDPKIPPGETLADFQEYARLYREAWGEPWTRWLLSVIPTAMIFDDHDVHDDWNTSRDWILEARSQGWWDERIIGGFMSYWIYQHLGNVGPSVMDDDPLYASVRESGDAADLLRDFAFRADRTVDTAQWSFRRDVGNARLVMIDSRAGRVLEPGRRLMVDDREWAFVAESAREPARHLLLATSLPWLLAPGMHLLEAWNEAVCDGAWGPLASRVAERVRQGLDLEHWAAFRESFERFCALVEEVGAGAHGTPPATITALSGDVHHAYLAEVAFPRGAAVRSHVHQATCSPFRNPLNARERRAIRFATGRGGALVGRTLARAARVPEPPIRWRYTHDDPWFDNMVATLRLDGDEACLTFERVVEDLQLEPVYVHKL